MIAFFARHPTAANLLMVIFLVAGIMNLGGLRRETFPDFQPEEVEIRVPYPGATAEEVNESVCQRVENALQEVRDVEELRCEAQEGLGVITVRMEEGGSYRDFKDEIDTGIDSIDDFPPEVEEPVIRRLHQTSPVLSLLVAGPMSVPSLKAYCEDLKDRLQQLPGISLITIKGFSDHQFRVELSEEALKRYNLSTAQVAEIIERQAVDTPAGIIQAQGTEVLVRLMEERKTARQLEDLIVVAGLGGAEIRLGDIAQISDRFEFDEDQILIHQLQPRAPPNQQSSPPRISPAPTSPAPTSPAPTSPADGPGEGELTTYRAGLLAISKTKEQDTIRVAQTVKEFVQQERQRLPQEKTHLTLEITQDTSKLVRDRLWMLVKNGGQGMVLVFLAMWLFFNFKLSFWVVMSLPVSFLGAFFLVPYVGLTINMLSMVGLLLALGLLMDDGIVIAENIGTHAASGKPPMQAAIDGVTQVRAGVLSSFLTTVCVLGPLVALSGNIGRVLEAVPIILLLVMGVSLIEAFFILPSHLGHSLNPADHQPGWLRRELDTRLLWFRDQLMGQTIDRLIRWRYLWIGCVLGAFFISAGMLAGGILKFQALPDLEGDVVVARVLLPQGTPLARTEQLVERITTAAARVNDQFRGSQPQGQDLVRLIYTEFNTNVDAFETGPHVATVYLDLLSADLREGRIDDVLSAWRDEAGTLPDAVAVTFTEPTLGPAGRNLEIRLRGQDLLVLKQAATKIREWLDGFQGVFNLADDLRAGKPELRIRLREGTYGLDVDAQTVAAQLRAAFLGVTADEIQVDDENYEIDIRLNPQGRDSLADLNEFRIQLPGGQRVPLVTIAQIVPGRGWGRIARIDRLPTVTLQGDIDSRRANTSQLIGLLQAELLPELRDQHPELQEVEIRGEIYEASVAQASMVQAGIIGLIGVFVLLSFQFRSFLEPLIVMIAIPFAFIGVIWGHLAMGLDLSMPSVLGFISLAGIVVNDSILLVLFLKMRRGQGLPASEAAGRASRERFRAIMITSVTTIAGLFPLVFERSLQAQVLIPLAVSIAFGLMASTVLVLLVIPCFYLVLEDFGLTARIGAGHEPIDESSAAQHSAPSADDASSQRLTHPSQSHETPTQQHSPEQLTAQQQGKSHPEEAGTPPKGQQDPQSPPPDKTRDGEGPEEPTEPNSSQGGQ